MPGRWRRVFVDRKKICKEVNEMEIKKIAVVGAGTMGNGIAHVFAQNDYEVELIDLKEEYVDRGVASITKNLDRQIKKETISLGDKTRTLTNIRKVIGIENISQNVDLVIEAIVEDKSAKLSLNFILCGGMINTYFYQID